jgi:methionine sulfoxide reductase heme-binding subunit
MTPPDPVSGARRPRGEAVLRVLVHLVLAVPAAWLLFAAFDDRLGADPIAVLTHETGQWALRLLLLTLALTPLRRLTGWQRPIRFRRALGLWAFAYACLHLGVYVGLDLGGYWLQLVDDLRERPFIMVGFLAWLLLVPLALTSTRAAMRRLGRRWQRLHRLVYVATGLAVLHFLWLVRLDPTEPLIYAALFAALMLLRLRWRPSPR